MSVPIALNIKFQNLKQGYLKYINDNRSKIKYSVIKPYKVKDYEVNGIVTPYHKTWREKYGNTGPFGNV